MVVNIREASLKLLVGELLRVVCEPKRFTHLHEGFLYALQLFSINTKILVALRDNFEVLSRKIWTPPVIAIVLQCVTMWLYENRSHVQLTSKPGRTHHMREHTYMSLYSHT